MIWRIFPLLIFFVVAVEELWEIRLLKKTAGLVVVGLGICTEVVLEWDIAVWVSKYFDVWGVLLKVKRPESEYLEDDPSLGIFN